QSSGVQGGAAWLGGGGETRSKKCPGGVSGSGTVIFVGVPLLSRVVSRRKAFTAKALRLTVPPVSRRVSRLAGGGPPGPTPACPTPRERDRATVRLSDIDQPQRFGLFEQAFDSRLAGSHLIGDIADAIALRFQVGGSLHVNILEIPHRPNHLVVDDLQLCLE